MSKLTKKQMKAQIINELSAQFDKKYQSLIGAESRLRQRCNEYKALNDKLNNENSELRDENASLKYKICQLRDYVERLLDFVNLDEEQRKAFLDKYNEFQKGLLRSEFYFEKWEELNKYFQNLL